jgi:hypothetical protein
MQHATRSRGPPPGFPQLTGTSKGVDPMSAPIFTPEVQTQLDRIVEDLDPEQSAGLRPYLDQMSSEDRALVVRVYRQECRAWALAGIAIPAILGELPDGSEGPASFLENVEGLAQKDLRLRQARPRSQDRHRLQQIQHSHHFPGGSMGGIEDPLLELLVDLQNEAFRRGTNLLATV